MRLERARKPVRRAGKFLLGRLGVSVTPQQERFRGYEPAFVELFERCKPYTMTSVERLYALYQATRYVVDAGIPGAIAECGVWRGGSMMLAAATLLDVGAADRELWLFDTFAGMTEPTERDRTAKGVDARLRWEASRAADHNDWCYAPLDEVRAAVLSTGYPEHLVHFVEGPVEETLPERAPAELSILRLDTDWYDSTRHELTELYPRLHVGGVLILDDYGKWSGARTAVDEYFSTRPPVLLHRIDHTGRAVVKTA